MAVSDIGAPGAGTLFVYGLEDLVEDHWSTLPRTQPTLTASPDSLLTHGIGDYTYLKAPEGVLGRGKFSTVYRVMSLNSGKHRQTSEPSPAPVLTSLNILPSAPSVVASVSTITATATTTTVTESTSTSTTTTTDVTTSESSRSMSSSPEPVSSSDTSPSSTSVPIVASTTTSSPTRSFPSADTTPVVSGTTTPVRPHFNDEPPKFFALKHTPLYPHHQLIAQRLLREPTLLAQLAPHPCLIGVDGFVRTEGHFYLVEDCAESHVPLPQHPYPLLPSRAAYLLDQLVSVVRDDLHAGRVCHRDLKGENVLVNPDTGDILLLDLGLATHFSASEPKLTTCCGSPAFHSPEIVNALNHRPGEVTYYGPELDIWCIALTMLSLLTQTRFPLGPHHTSRTVMAQRASEILHELDCLYPPSHPWRIMGTPLSEEEQAYETKEWKRVRRAMHTFVNIRATQRIAAFQAYDVGDKVRARVEAYPKTRAFKTTAFVPADVKYTIPLYLEDGDPTGPIILRNPANEPERRIVSYIKYLLRSSGILYHHVPGTHPPILQLVLPLLPEEPKPNGPGKNWVSNLFRRPGPVRSSSVPPPTLNSARAQHTKNASDSGGNEKGKGKESWHQQVWLKIEVKRSKSRSRAASRAPSQGGSRVTSQASSRAPSRAGGHRTSSSRMRSEPNSRTPSTAGVDRRVQIDLGSLHGALMSVTGATAIAGGMYAGAPPQRRRASSSCASKVVLTLTEPRGYPQIRKALSAATPPSETELGKYRESRLSSMSSTSALDIPQSSSEESHPEPSEEEERGRPRSKDAPEFKPASSSSTTPRRQSKMSPHQHRSVAVGEQAPSALLESVFGKEGANAAVAERIKEGGKEGQKRSWSVPPSQLERTE